MKKKENKKEKEKNEIRPIGSSIWPGPANPVRASATAKGQRTPAPAQQAACSFYLFLLFLFVFLTYLQSNANILIYIA
jgi:hypothetical protein